MREGSKKKHLGKKNIPPIFGKVNEGDQIKKNIGQISGKVNEDDEIKKNWTFLNKVNEGGEKNKQKNIAGKKFFYFLKWTCFFIGMFFFIYQN